MAWNFVQHLPGQDVLTPRQKLLILHSIGGLTTRYELPPGTSIKSLRQRVVRLVRNIAAHDEAVASTVWMVQTLYQCLCYGESAYRTETNRRNPHDRPVLRRTLAAVLSRRPLTWPDIISDPHERANLLARGIPPASLPDRNDWSVEHLETAHHRLRRPASASDNDRRLSRKVNDGVVDLSLKVTSDSYSKTKDTLRTDLTHVFAGANARGLTALGLLLRVDAALNSCLTFLTTHPTETVQLERKVRLLMNDIRRMRRLIADSQERKGNALATIVAVRHELQNAGLLDAQTGR